MQVSLSCTRSWTCWGIWQLLRISSSEENLRRVSASMTRRWMKKRESFLTGCTLISIRKRQWADWQSENSRCARLQKRSPTKQRLLSLTSRQQPWQRLRSRSCSRLSVTSGIRDLVLYIFLIVWMRSKLLQTALQSCETVRMSEHWLQRILQRMISLTWWSVVSSMRIRRQRIWHLRELRSCLR